MHRNSISNGQYLSYIDFNYRIDQFLITVCSSIRGKPPLSTDDTVKMIDFSSIFYRFQMPYPYPQEFASHSATTAGYG